MQEIKTPFNYREQVIQSIIDNVHPLYIAVGFNEIQANVLTNVLLENIRGGLPLILDLIDDVSSQNAVKEFKDAKNPLYMGVRNNAQHFYESYKLVEETMPSEPNTDPSDSKAFKYIVNKIQTAYSNL